MYYQHTTRNTYERLESRLGPRGPAPATSGEASAATDAMLSSRKGVA